MAGIARFSRVLVGVQLAISVGLITCTLVMYHQLEHLIARDLGIDQERVIAVDTEALKQHSPQHPVLMESFLRHSRIVSATTLRENFLKKPYWFRVDFRAGTESDRETKIRPYAVDHNFVETMNLELVRGRDFSLAQGDKKNLALISERAAARLGLADPIGEMIKVGYMSRSEMVWGRKGGENRIIGVVKDFTFESGYEDATPGLLLLNSDLGPRYSRGNLIFRYEADLMLVRVKPGDMQEVVQYMQETWSRIVDYDDFKFSFLQQDLEAAYRDELRWRQLITWAAVGAVFISVLGAFALTALAAGRRTKEIGIRKALGASVFGLTTLMTREFACLALIGALVAWPLSWWWMRDWLNGFAFRIDLAAWHFAAGAAIALVAVLVSSGHQAYKAAKADPVEALRYE